MDPRMFNSMSGNNQFGNAYDGAGYQDPFGDNSMSMEERMLERRAQRMYQALAEKGQFGQIDKAKHDINYRNYLLQNFDEDEYGYY